MFLNLYNLNFNYLIFLQNKKFEKVKEKVIKNVFKFLILPIKIIFI